MIDIDKSKEAFKTFLNNYDDKNDSSFKLKVVHTYHVANNAKSYSSTYFITYNDYIINLHIIILILDYTDKIIHI